MIKPSVGRKVWYRPSAYDLSGPGAMQVASANPLDDTYQPLDATVIAVWTDRMINILVTDAVGKQFPKLSVTLLQEGDAKGGPGVVNGGYAEWMPYQTAQAKATEQQ